MAFVQNETAELWRVTWAFPIKKTVAKHEGYDRISVNGDIIFDDEYPECHYSGEHHLTVCSCGHLGCAILRDNIFTCERCGTQGMVGDYSDQAIKAGTDA